MTSVTVDFTAQLAAAILASDTSYFYVSRPAGVPDGGPPGLDYSGPAGVNVLGPPSYMELELDMACVIPGLPPGTLGAVANTLTFLNSYDAAGGDYALTWGGFWQPVSNDYPITGLDGTLELLNSYNNVTGAARAKVGGVLTPQQPDPTGTSIARVRGNGPQSPTGVDSYWLTPFFGVAQSAGGVVYSAKVIYTWLPTALIAAGIAPGSLASGVLTHA